MSLIFPALLLALTSGPAGDDRLAAEVAAIVAPRFERGEAVGIVVGVVRDGKSRVFGFGRPSVDADQPPDGRTLFEIGSITKVFTSIALADMAREGIVGLDDPVVKLLPPGTVVPEREGQVITLRRLAQHASGLPRIIPKVALLAASGKDPYQGVVEEDLYKFLKGHHLSTTPGTKYAYSNLGAGLLGTALAVKSGVTFEELIQARVCRPMGMLDTRMALDPAQSLRLARPYKQGGDDAIAWNFDAFAGAGGLRSSADDMLRFARACMGEVELPARLRTAIADTQTPTFDAGRPGLKIGLAWHVTLAADKSSQPRLVWHNGGTAGFRSFLGISPATRCAVVVLSNTDAEVDSIGLAVLRKLERRPPP